jgi:hypothetical protein
VSLFVYVRVCQIAAANYTDIFPPGAAVVGGVMLAGGSYNCYHDATSSIYGPDPAMGSCKGCIPGDINHCFYPPQPKQCSSCFEDVVPYCQQCCPRNFTEQ